MKIKRLSFRVYKNLVLLAVMIVVLVIMYYDVVTSRIFPTVTINGKSAHLILDTGSSSTFLTESGARRLGIKFSPPSPNFTAQWFDKKVPVSLSEPIDLTVGAVKVIVQLQVGAMPGIENDGGIGWPEIRDAILVFDAEHHTVSSVDELPTETASWLKLKVRPSSVLNLEIPLSDGKTGTILVDTGEPRGVVLASAQWKEWKAAHPWAMKADEIKLGTLTLTDVPVSEATQHGLADDYVGTLGMGALARMDLIVDAKNGFAYLHPNLTSGPAVWTVSYNVRLQRDTLILSSVTYKMAMNDYDGAIADCTHVIELDPKNVLAYISRGGIRTVKGDLDGAIADCTQALVFDPKNIGAYQNRAAAKQKKGGFDGSIADYTQVIALDPKNAGAYLSRGADEVNNGDIDDAIADCTHALELDPKNAEAYRIRGAVKMKKDDLDGAMADCTKALEIDPKNFGAYQTRGYARQKKADFPGAMADFNHILEIDPKNAGAYISRSYAKADNDDFDGAIADCNHLLELDPENAGAYYNRAYARDLRGDFAAALPDYDIRIELKPDDSDYPRLFRQLLLRRLGRPPEDFSAVVAGWKDAWHRTVGQFVAGNLNERDFLAAAANAGEKTVQQQQCEAYYYIGMIHLLKDDTTGARNYLQKCLATEVKDYNEYHFARVELARLDGGSKQGAASLPQVLGSGNVVSPTP